MDYNSSLDVAEVPGHLRRFVNGTPAAGIRGVRLPEALEKLRTAAFAPYKGKAADYSHVVHEKSAQLADQTKHLMER